MLRMQWYFQCNAAADSELRYVHSRCSDTAGNLIMAAQQECEADGNHWGASAYGCIDLGKLTSGQSEYLVTEAYNQVGLWRETFPETTSQGSTYKFGENEDTVTVNSVADCNLKNQRVFEGSVSPNEEECKPLHPLGHVQLTVVYWTAFYWSITTMTTLGYSELHATDSAEQRFVMFSIMIGVVVFAYGITNMCTLVANLNAQEVFAQTRSDEIIEWMSNNSVPDHFKKKVQQYFTYKISESPVFYYDGATLLEELSPELKKAVLVEHYLPILHYSPVFAFATMEALNDASEDSKLAVVGPIIEALQCEVFFPGETIADVDLFVRGAFFIVHGNVTVVTANGEQLSLQPGEVYGEVRSAVVLPVG